MRLLLVEDEPLIADALLELLRGEGYATDLARCGRHADELAAANVYDLVILDWNIPNPSGIELVRRWRRSGLHMPILMLTGRTALEDRVGGLDCGADDYLTKPFALDELLARARSLLRRAAFRPELAELRAADLVMDRAARTVSVAGRPVALSPKEFAVLEFLLTRKDQVISRGVLAEHAWDDSFDPMSNVIDVTVHRLRRKIDGDRDARLLHTVKGVGYVLHGSRS